MLDIYGYKHTLRICTTYCASTLRYTCIACPVNPLNAELNPICHLLALLGGATIVVVSRLRVKPPVQLHQSNSCRMSNGTQTSACFTTPTHTHTHTSRTTQSALYTACTRGDKCFVYRRCQLQMLDSVSGEWVTYGLLMEWYWQGGKKIAGEKPAAMPLYFPQISHALRQGLKLGLRDKPRRGQDAAACGES